MNPSDERSPVLRLGILILAAANFPANFRLIGPTRSRQGDRVGPRNSIDKVRSGQFEKCPFCEVYTGVVKGPSGVMGGGLTRDLGRPSQSSSEPRADSVQSFFFIIPRVLSV